MSVQYLKRNVRIALGGAFLVLIAGCVETTPSQVGALPSSAKAPAGYSAAEERLFALPIPQYYAALITARSISARCARYDFDTRRDLQINEDRNKIGKGSFAAVGQRKAIAAQAAATQAQVFGAYGVDPKISDLCVVGDGETRKATAISAVLVAK